jgi:arginyl-tRNA synthetase (EC 6.1.1.19)
MALSRVSLESFRRTGWFTNRKAQKWFKVSQFCEDDDKVLVRSTGSYTYFMTDIAYHTNKFERGFVKVYDIWGADHMGHIPRMKAAMKALELPDDF